MKAALHRSITFWSGLLVMLFVCWAWRDAMKQRSVLHWTSAGGMSFWNASSNAGALVLSRLRQSDGTHWIKVQAVNPTTWRRSPQSKESLQWVTQLMAGRPFAYHRNEDRGEDAGPMEQLRGPRPPLPLPGFLGDHWAVSYFSLAFVHFVLWLGLLFSRARRRNKTVITP